MKCKKLSKLLANIKRNFAMRTTLEQFLMILSCFLFIIFISLVLALIYTSNEEPMPAKDKMCKDSNCVRQVSYILEKINLSVNPCEDFYEFACGSYMKNHVLDDDVHVHSISDDIEDEIYRTIRNYLESAESEENGDIQDAVAFYQSCDKRADGFKDIKDLIQLIILSGKFDAIKHSGDMKEFFAELTTYGSNPFFNVSILKVNNTFHIKLSKPEHDTILTHLKEDIHCIREKAEHFLSNTNYKELLRNTLLLWGKVTSSSEKDLSSEIIDFEGQLAKNISKINCDLNLTYSCNLQDEKQKWGHLVIKYIIPAMDYDKVIVEDECDAYTMEIFCNILNKSIVKDYLLWRHVIRFLPLISSAFRRSYVTLMEQLNTGNNVLINPKYFPQKWKQCVHLTNNMYSFSIADVYKKNEFNDDWKDEMVSIFDLVKDTYLELLNSHQSLSNDTNTYLVEKLENMKIAVGSPSFLSEFNKVSCNFYVPKFNENFMKTMLQSEQNIIKNTFENKPAYNESWFITNSPISNTIGLDTKNNVLVVPMGVFYFPYYVPNDFKFAKYARFGTHIAQVIHSIFGSEIHDYFFNEMYDFNTECYKTQYIKSNITSGDDKNQKYLDRNWYQIIQDNVVFNIALKIYEKEIERDEEKQTLPGIKYDSEKLFFIQYAQTFCEVSNISDWTIGKHLPAKFRINNVMMNSKKFSETFSCSKDSIMNPKNKCQMWE